MSKRKKHLKEEGNENSRFIHKDVERAIWIVVFTALSFIMLFSIIEKGGRVGEYINKASFLVLGISDCSLIYCPVYCWKL